MAKKRTDPKTEALVCQLRKDGLKVDAIVKQTGVSQGTVKDILARNGLTKKKASNPSADNNGQADAHARPNDAPDSIPSANPSPNPAMNPSAGQIDPNLTQVNASRELIQYVQFFRSRTRKIPYTDLSPHDTVWAEGMYGKRWESGIALMINTTGLSPESIQQALDDYEIDVADALERFNSRYRKEEQDAGD